MVPSNFIKSIIESDLESKKHSYVRTRFPPEPNGCLHIGHSKSICLNFGLALDFNGNCNLRFDDTNPTKEDVEYVEAIKADVQWLGFDWGEGLFHASDYFDKLYGFAEELIVNDRAYVCSLNEAEMRQYRGTVTTAGTASPDRERPQEENLDLFRRMKAGEFEDGTYTLRAKIDMASPNMKMRDPPIYRIRRVPHHRTGDDWCIYPMYDFAHCLSDAIEGITHSICTLEFENNRELYDWILDNVAPPCHPQQIEFARLNLTHTVMSKRRLLTLVEGGHVSGWDDPRMPTIAGLRRRGYTAQAIRAFAERIGLAKANSVVDLGILEHCIRDDLNFKAPRVMCVRRPLKVEITNYPQGKVEWLEASYWPRDVPREGVRTIPFSRHILIEQDDFREDPPKKFFRLAPGVEVRLRYGYVIRCIEVIKDEQGNIASLRCTYDPDTRSGTTPDGRKIKGTLHWVAEHESLPVEIREYDRLFLSAEPSGDPNEMNPDSLQVVQGRIEPSVKDSAVGAHYQFERLGYFCVDLDSKSKGLVVNRVVSLRDSWAKMTTSQKQARPKEPTVAKPLTSKSAAKPGRSTTRDSAQEAQYQRLKGRFSFNEEQADLLATNSGLLAIFDGALSVHDNPRAIANWCTNELGREAKGQSLADLPMGGAQLGALVALIDENVISGKIAKKVLAEMVANGGEPRAIVDSRGWSQMADSAALEAVVDEVLSQNGDAVARYKAGNQRLIGFFVGQVMKATRGRANPTVLQVLLRQRLEE
ncbi:MAG: glutamine--tRNA ligase/YqeY domain fusion protein [Proteobacteria bacterium]|nr:glutamine--tRNA ligase/YqeY domain fusion protein [Pseudomonadota bacterium]